MITDTVAWLLDETSQIEFEGTDRPTAGGEDSFMGTWQDPDLDASARLDALVAEMSLPEKLAQLGSIWLRFDVVTGEVAPMQSLQSRHPMAGGGGERNWSSHQGVGDETNHGR